jgi:hypothetical protein
MALCLPGTNPVVLYKSAAGHNPHCLRKHEALPPMRYAILQCMLANRSGDTDPMCLDLSSRSTNSARPTTPKFMNAVVE